MPSTESQHPVIEIATVFLRIGAMSYGGPAIMGIMQSEIQERRQWISKERFVEGLAVVNTLPGPQAAQLALFLGHARCAIAAGLGFILPAFFVMVGLTWIYTVFGTVPAVREALYGIGPVVLGIFALAIYRLGTATIKDHWQVALLLGAAAVIGLSPIGLVPVLFASGAMGRCLYHSRCAGLITLSGVPGVCTRAADRRVQSRAAGAGVARDRTSWRRAHSGGARNRRPPSGPIALR